MGSNFVSSHPHVSGADISTMIFPGYSTGGTPVAPGWNADLGELFALRRRRRKQI